MRARYGTVKSLTKKRAGHCPNLVAAISFSFYRFLGSYEVTKFLVAPSDSIRGVIRTSDGWLVGNHFFGLLGATNAVDTALCFGPHG